MVRCAVLLDVPSNVHGHGEFPLVRKVAQTGDLYSSVGLSACIDAAFSRYPPRLCRLSQVFVLVLPEQEVAEIMAGITYGLSILFSGNLIPVSQISTACLE